VDVVVKADGFHIFINRTKAYVFRHRLPWIPGSLSLSLFLSLSLG
jgi:hypothetical protein